MPNVKGGAAIPISESYDGPVQGPAIPVYVLDSSTLNHQPVRGGPALPVRTITDDDLAENGGEFTLTDDIPVAVVQVTGRPVQGGAIQAIYIVGGAPIVTVDLFLLEDGDKFLFENDDRVLVEF